MIAEIKRRKTPEEENLHKKLAELTDLESNLAERELELATLHGELQAFEIQYLHTIGTRYAELDEIEAQIAELQARLAPKNKNSQKHAEQARTKAQESSPASEDIQDKFKQEKFTPSENLRKLYRKAAKSVHPDLANDEKDRARRQSFMAEANCAYEQRDEARLEAVLREWEISPESVKGDGVGAELVRVIRKIAQVQERLRVIDTEIDKLRRSEIYHLKIRVEEAENEERDLLEEMATHLDVQIALARQELKKYAGLARIIINGKIGYINLQGDYVWKPTS